MSFQDMELVSALLESGMDLGLAVTKNVAQVMVVSGLLSPLENW